MSKITEYLNADVTSWDLDDINRQAFIKDHQEHVENDEALDRVLHLMNYDADFLELSHKDTEGAIKKYIERFNVQTQPTKKAYYTKQVDKFEKDLVLIKMALIFRVSYPK